MSQAFKATFLGDSPEMISIPPNESVQFLLKFHKSKKKKYNYSSFAPSIRLNTTYMVGHYFDPGAGMTRQRLFSDVYKSHCELFKLFIATSHCEAASTLRHVSSADVGSRVVPLHAPRLFPQCLLTAQYSYVSYANFNYNGIRMFLTLVQPNSFTFQGYHLRRINKISVKEH